VTRARTLPRLRGTRKARRRVLALHAQGYSVPQTAALSHLPPQAVRAIVKRQRLERLRKVRKEH
jgi:hypothetical protein